MAALNIPRRERNRGSPRSVSLSRTSFNAIKKSTTFCVALKYFFSPSPPSRTVTKSGRQERSASTKTKRRIGEKAGIRLTEQDRVRDVAHELSDRGRLPQRLDRVRLFENLRLDEKLRVWRGRRGRRVDSQRWAPQAAGGSDRAGEARREQSVKVAASSLT